MVVSGRNDSTLTEPMTHTGFDSRGKMHVVKTKPKALPGPLIAIDPVGKSINLTPKQQCNDQNHISEKGF